MDRHRTLHLDPVGAASAQIAVDVRHGHVPGREPRLQ